MSGKFEEMINNAKITELLKKQRKKIKVLFFGFWLLSVQLLL